jgi:hypothetical protein
VAAMVMVENGYSEDFLHCEENKSGDGTTTTARIWFP